MGIARQRQTRVGQRHHSPSGLQFAFGAGCFGFDPGGRLRPRGLGFGQFRVGGADARQIAVVAAKRNPHPQQHQLLPGFGEIAALPGGANSEFGGVAGIGGGLVQARTRALRCARVRFFHGVRAGRRCCPWPARLVFGR